MLMLAFPTLAEMPTGEYMGMLYTDNTVTVEIVGYTSDLPLKLEIPPIIDDMIVTSIADGAFADSRLIDITIPSTVSHIGEGVFFGCKQGLKVHIQETSNIHIADDLVYDNDGTMLFCDDMDTFTHTQLYPQFKRIGVGAVSKYSNFSANLPNVKSVGEYAFAESSIIRTNFASLETIEPHAFEDASIGKMYFGALKSIGENAFTGARGELYFCCDAPEIAESAFENVKGIKIYYANHMQGWDELSFDNVEIEMYNPGITELKFRQMFEGTPSDNVFASVQVYNNLSLCDDVMPEMPETDGYIIGGHALDNIYGIRMTSFVPEDQPPEEPEEPEDPENPEEPEEPVEIPVYIEEASEYIRYYRDITHTVTFKENLNGTVLDVQQVKRSYDAVYPEAPEYEYYYFDAWGAGIIEVTEDREIYATYRLDPIYCMVRFYDGYLLMQTGMSSEAVMSGEIVEKGTKLVYPEVKQYEGYDFIGWSETPEYAYGDYLSIWANYEIQVFHVTFIDTTDNSEFAAFDVEYGNDVTMPDPPLHVDYKFTGWSDDGKNIKEDRTIYAYYEAKAPRYTTGDANGDGKVDTADAVQILKFSAGMLHLSNDKKKAADTNHDGTVNTADAVLILKYAAGMITEF